MEISEFCELQEAIKVANFFLHSSKLLEFAIKYKIILAPMLSVNCKKPSKWQISFFTRVELSRLRQGAE